MQIPS
jgi:hypothetical protein